MSIARHRGPLPLLNVSEEERSNWRRHQLSAFTPFECFLGQPVAFGELMSTDDVFEDASGVHRLKFQAAEALLQVFMKLFCGEIDAEGAIALWLIYEDVVYAFARRYDVTELLERNDKANFAVGSPGGFSSEQEYADGEFKLTEVIINYVGRYERYLALGLHDEFPGPARPPVHLPSWAFCYLDISLNLDTAVADQLSEVLEALCFGTVSLAQVSAVWPDWLRLAKAFTDSYEVDPARTLAGLGSLDDPDQIERAVLGPLEREYLATVTLFLDMYRQDREEGSQEVVSFRDEPDPEQAELEHVVRAWEPAEDYGFADAGADELFHGWRRLNKHPERRLLSELRRFARLAAWGFVDQAWIEDRWPQFFVLADDLAREQRRPDLQDAYAHLGAEPGTREAYLTGLLRLIDAVRMSDGDGRGH